MEKVAESLPKIPLDVDLETKAVLKKLITSHKALAELKGMAATIPNETILLSTLPLQEAKDSSAIENIITTNDELFKSDVLQGDFASVAAKEVHHYTKALLHGFELIQETGLLTNNHILQIQSIIEENSAGFRKTLGTVLKNDLTGEVIYTPPQHIDDIQRLMTELERLINDSQYCAWDPLIKMAIIHYQFESIHPFYDGNGRTGRIINILYLVKEDLLKIPILYLSRYINQNKGIYYHFLQEVRTGNKWEEWVLFILEGVEQTSKKAINLIEEIKLQMGSYKQAMRKQLPKVYSQDLLNNIFQYPYTKIDFVVRDLAVSRPTATKYLEELTQIKLLQKHKLGLSNYYVNTSLFNLLGGGAEL